MRNITIATLVAGLLTAGAATVVAGEEKILTIGDAIPANISMRDIDGKEHKFSDYRGKTVVLDFWSFKCPVSRDYEARFNRFHAEFKDKDVVLLAIDSCYPDIDTSGEDPYASIRAYVEKEKIEFPILIDENNEFADLLDAQTTPHVYIADKEGVLRYIGAVDNDQKGDKGDEAKHWMRDAIGNLMRGEKVALERTKNFGCSIKRKKSA